MNACQCSRASSKARFDVVDARATQMFWRSQASHYSLRVPRKSILATDCRQAGITTCLRGGSANRRELDCITNAQNRYYANYCE